MPWFIGLQLCFYCSKEEEKKEAIAAVFQRHERCLISLRRLSFSFQLHVSVSTTYFPSSSPESPQSRISGRLSLLSFFSPPLYSTCNFAWISSSLSTHPTGSYEPSVSGPSSTTRHSTLCSRAKFADSHLSMSRRLAISKPFPLPLPKAGRSSCFIPRWARGETRKAVWQPPDPSSVICKGKNGTHLIEGESILVFLGREAGMRVVILVSGGS